MNQPSPEVMQQIVNFLLKTSVPRIIEKEKKKQQEGK